MIEGLSHITFIVRDLNRMEKILTGVLDAKKVYDSGAATFSVSREKFFLVGAEPTAAWVVIMEGESLPTRTYNHAAFKISETDYPVRLERIRAPGLEETRDALVITDSWIFGPVLKMVGEFEHSVKKHPLIAMGTPDPYTPPK
jgi:catechol 2,3-dioxygenase-like lactoylglutathione lyase family enzyme